MTTLAAITLTAPAMLMGMAGLALPIAAHLLQRRTPRRILFPTVRFLHDAAAGHASLSRVRRWLVLALRCLAMALLVAAFAQPVWFHGSAAPPGLEQSVGVVLVIDNSASSRQTVGGVSLIESLRTDARRALGELRSGTDAADIVYAAPAPTPFLPRLTPNIDSLEREAEVIPATDARADLPGAIALASDLLEHRDGPRRIVVLSDMQTTNWADLAKTSPQSTVPITVIPVGSAGSANIALSRPRVFSNVALLAGQPVPVVVEVHNFSGEPAFVRVGLSLDDNPIGSREVALSPWKSGEAAFDVRLPSPGWHALIFSIPPDALAADNTACLAVHAAAQMTVAIISDAPGTPAPGTSEATGAYFLARAVAPVSSRQITSRQIDASQLRDTQAVLIDRVDQLSPTAVATLADYAVHGGGLMIFCGPGFIPANLELLNEALRRRKINAFPVRPIILQSPAKTDDGFRITGGDWNSPLLHDFDERGRIALERVRFNRIWSLQHAGMPEGWQTVLRFAGNTPALVWRDNLALANFSPAADAGDLGKHGVFVALMHVLLEHLQHRSDPPPPQSPGGDLFIPVTAPIDAAADDMVLINPDGGRQSVKARSVGPDLAHVESSGSRTGFYRLVRGGETIGLTGVNIDPRESDLRRDDPATAAASLATSRTVAAMTARTADPLELHGRPLWPWFVLGAIVVLCVELSLLAIWKG